MVQTSPENLNPIGW